MTKSDILRPASRTQPCQLEGVVSHSASPATALLTWTLEALAQFLCCITHYVILSSLFFWET